MDTAAQAGRIVTVAHCVRRVDDLYDRELQRTLSDVKQGHRELAHERLDLLLEIEGTRSLLAEITSSLESSSAIECHVITSAWLLRHAHQELTSTDKEAMCYATGSSIGSLHAVERLVALTYMEQSEVFVAADDESTIKALRDLSANGQQIQVWFHSHPGAGREATRPSGIDLAYQADLERAGFKTIGGIFTRDGLVRFFSKDLQFSLTITGKRVVNLGHDVFQIEEV